MSEQESNELGYLYYPGCTLHERARGYDLSGRAAAAALSINLEEMEGWTCCGTTVPLENRRIVGLLAPMRTLHQVRRAGREELLTLCTFCYNVLKRASYTFLGNELDRRRITTYLQDEAERQGEQLAEYGEEGVQVVHLLEVLRDRIGFPALAERVKRPLGLRVAPYYGCLLLRPKSEIQLDDDEEPTILDDLLRALGCEVIDFPHKVECCGSYLGLSAPDTALEASYEIIQMASRLGAEVIAVVCPLCSYNLDRRQEEMSDRFIGFSHIPALYFTQLLALALDLGEEPCRFTEHAVDPLPLLRGKQLL